MKKTGSKPEPFSRIGSYRLVQQLKIQMHVPHSHAQLLDPTPLTTVASHTPARNVLVPLTHGTPLLHARLTLLADYQLS